MNKILRFRLRYYREYAEDMDLRGIPVSRFKEWEAFFLNEDQATMLLICRDYGFPFKCISVN